MTCPTVTVVLRHAQHSRSCAKPHCQSVLTQVHSRGHPDLRQPPATCVRRPPPSPLLCCPLRAEGGPVWQVGSDTWSCCPPRVGEESARNTPGRFPLLGEVGRTCWAPPKVEAASMVLPLPKVGGGGSWVDGPPEVGGSRMGSPPPQGGGGMLILPCMGILPSWYL